METESLPPARNLPLDFFRGVALIVIFINHMPENPWFYYTPSRFGLSDAAEAFVFLSGFAAAIAYGRGYEKAGLGQGTLRILLRSMKIYSTHLVLVFTLATLCVLGNRGLSGVDYIHRLNLSYFFDQTQEALFGMVSLRYIPMYLDILPMYTVVMLWIPLVWALSRFHYGLALGVSALVYLSATFWGWDLPADPLSNRVWFFNPFAWQFMFFTGFALGSGWLKVPLDNPKLLYLAGLILLLSVPLGHEPTFRRFECLLQWRLSHPGWVDKTHLGLLRWVHFLALAYLLNHCCRRNPNRLNRAIPRWIAVMGRQSLPMFFLGTCLSYLGGMVLDNYGRSPLFVAAVNLTGLGLLLITAQSMYWLDGKPWKRGVQANSSLELGLLRQSAPWILLTGLALLPFALLLPGAETVPSSLASAKDYPTPAPAQSLETEDSEQRFEFSNGL